MKKICGEDNYILYNSSLFWREYFMVTITIVIIFESIIIISY